MSYPYRTRVAFIVQGTGLQQDPSPIHTIIHRLSVNSAPSPRSIEVLVLLLAFAIPILGLGLSGYQEWLKFRTRQQELGASTQDVEETVQALRDRLDQVEQERDALERRVQNLETIVTSETWDALHGSTSDPSSLPDPDNTLDLEPPNQSERPSASRERAEELARRLRT